MVKHPSEKIPHQEQTAVFLKLGMPPDVFRRLQDKFVNDLAKVLKCDPREIKVLDVQSASPEEDNPSPVRWNDLSPDNPIRKSRDEHFGRILALKKSWKESKKYTQRVSEENLSRAVIGYAALIEQRLLASREYPNCKILVDTSKQPPVLQFSDGTPVTMSALGAAIEFCSGTRKGIRSSELAEAITTSLADHRDILPNIVVEQEGTNIVLRPRPDDSHRQHFKDRLEREKKEFGQ